MNANQLIFLANVEPEVGQALVKLANAMEKRAADNPSAFNESVPSAQSTPQANDASGVQVYGKAAPGQAVPAQPPVAGPDPLVPEPVQPAGAPADIDPVMAAQEFMRPVFEAAAAGDAGAQSTLAQTAAAIMRGVVDANLQNQATVDEMTAQSQAAPADYSGVIDPAQQQQMQAYYDQQMQNANSGTAPEATAQPPQANADGVPVTVSPEQVADQIVPDSTVVAKPKTEKKKEEPKKK